MIHTPTLSRRIKAITGLRPVDRRREGIHLSSGNTRSATIAGCFDSHRMNREIVALLAEGLPEHYTVEIVDEFTVRVTTKEA